MCPKGMKKCKSLFSLFKKKKYFKFTRRITAKCSDY